MLELAAVFGFFRYTWPVENSTCKMEQNDRYVETICRIPRSSTLVYSWLHDTKELPGCCKCSEPLLYADDTKLLSYDLFVLQNDLLAVSKRSTDYKTIFMSSKTSLLQFAYFAACPNLPVCLFDNEENCISRSPVKYLGIITIPNPKRHELVRPRIKMTHLRWMMPEQCYPEKNFQNEVDKIYNRLYLMYDSRVVHCKTGACKIACKRR